MIPLLMALLFQPIQVSYPHMFNPHRVERITPLTLIKRNHKVTQGTVCLYPLEVKCIDDVCGDNKSYWEVSVNGNTRDYNANSTVRRGDVVRWKYVSLKEK